MSGNGKNLPDALREVVQDAVAQILQIARPRRIVLFGSWATGRADQASDMDILVVAETDRPFQLAATLLEPVRAALAPRRVDLVVVTPEQWDFLQHVPGQIVHEAAHYGVWLYEAA